MVQKNFAAILLIAAAAMFAPVLAAPTTLDLAVRNPRISERALTFDEAPLQSREVDDAMDLVERSFDDAISLNQREVFEGVELEERDIGDGLAERSFEDGIELEERGLEDAVLEAREPFILFDKIKGLFQRKKKKDDDDDLA